MPCASCNDAVSEFAACGVKATAGAMLGVAGMRGALRAASVARQVGTAPDWPPFEGKARTIALRWVHDPPGDDATRERLALACWKSVAREWERLRADAAKVWREIEIEIEPTWPL